MVKMNTVKIQSDHMIVSATRATNSTTMSARRKSFLNGKRTISELKQTSCSEQEATDLRNQKVSKVF